MQTKTCTKCKIEKSIKNFYKQRQGKYGVGSRCKSCRLKEKQTPKYVQKRIAYRKSALGKASRKREIVKRYNLTLEQYDKMFEIQNGVCFVCNEANPSGNRLHVDHNHKTGKIRKLLCTRCNLLAGRLEKDNKIVEKIRKYLKAHQE